MTKTPSAIALAALLLWPAPARGQVGTALTLACNGTTSDGTEDAKREPISMGIIVNFTTRSVQGFGAPGFFDYPVKITGGTMWLWCLAASVRLAGF
jgi:hypothetical protein